MFPYKTKAIVPSDDCLILTSSHYSCHLLRNIMQKNTIAYRRLLTLLITLLPINIAIQIAMLVIILRPSPNN